MQGASLILISVYNQFFVQLENITGQQEDVFKCMTKMHDDFDAVRSVFLYSDVGQIVDSAVTQQITSSVNIGNLEVDFSSFRVDFLATLVVVLTDDIDHVKKYFNLLVASPGYNSKARYFIIYLGDDDLNRLFVILDWLNLQKVVILDKKNDMYAPRNFRHTCGINIEKIFLFNCDKYNKTLVEAIYNRKLIDFNGCLIRTVTYTKKPFVNNPNDLTNPGIEVNILNTAAAKYNFTVMYVKHNYSNYGIKYPDGSYGGALALIRDHEADIIFGNIRCNATLLEHFDATTPCLESSYSFYVPIARPVLKWTAMITIYKPLTWLTLGVAFIIYNITFYQAARRSRHPENYNSCHYLIMQTFGALIARTVTLPQHFLIRVLLLTWVLFSFIFSVSYEGSLLSAIIKPTYEDQISTLEEIVALNLNIRGTTYARDIFRFGEGVSKTIYQKWELCPDPAVCLNETAELRTAATMENTATLGATKNLYLDERNVTLLYALKPSLKFYSWMIVNKGFPIVIQLNKIILYLRENGLMEKWKVDSAVKVIEKENNEFSPLALSMLIFIYYIWLGGCGLALIVFVFELRISRRY